LCSIEVGQLSITFIIIISMIDRATLLISIIENKALVIGSYLSVKASKPVQNFMKEITSNLTEIEAV